MVAFATIVVVVGGAVLIVIVGVGVFNVVTGCPGYRFSTCSSSNVNNE